MPFIAAISLRSPTSTIARMKGTLARATSVCTPEKDGHLLFAITRVLCARRRPNAGGQVLGLR